MQQLPPHPESPSPASYRRFLAWNLAEPSWFALRLCSSGRLRRTGRKVCQIRLAVRTREPFAVWLSGLACPTVERSAVVRNAKLTATGLVYGPYAIRTRPPRSRTDR